MEAQSQKLNRNGHGINISLDHHAMLPGAQWGFVVYRTFYGLNSDALWARMLEALGSTITSESSHLNLTDLLTRYELTVIEDENMLASADAHTVRHASAAGLPMT